MRHSRIQAVEHVVREAAVGLEDALRWFYVDVAGLEPIVADGQADGALLRFRSAQIEVQLRMVSNPQPEPTAFPVIIGIPSLEEAAELLGERSVAFETVSGISWPDRRLATSDPAGNRVELKREWPDDPL